MLAALHVLNPDAVHFNDSEVASIANIVLPLNWSCPPPLMVTVHDGSVHVNVISLQQRSPPLHVNELSDIESPEHPSWFEHVLAWTQASKSRKPNQCI